MEGGVCLFCFLNYGETIMRSATDSMGLLLALILNLGGTAERVS